MDQKANVYDLRSGRPVAANDDRLQAENSQQIQVHQNLDLGNETEYRRPRSFPRTIAKILVFLILQPMLLLRMLLNILPLMIVISCMAFAIIWFGMDASAAKTKMLIGLGAVSLGLTTFLWCYDVVLERLQFWLLYD